MDDNKKGDDSEERKKIEEFLNNLKSAKDSFARYMDIRNEYQEELIEEIQIYVSNLRSENKIYAGPTTDEFKIWESVRTLSLSMWDQTEHIISDYFDNPEKSVDSSCVFSEFDKGNSFLQKIHSINKKQILKQFPEIIDLDSNGFLELEYTLQIDSIGMYDALFEEGGFLEEDDWIE